MKTPHTIPRTHRPGRRVVGPPVFVVLFRYTQGTGRGGRRERLCEIAVDQQLIDSWILRYGPGTYRIEYRDSRSWVCGAKTVRYQRLGAFMSMEEGGTKVPATYERTEPQPVSPEMFDRWMAQNNGKVHPIHLRRQGIFRPPNPSIPRR